MHMRFGKDAYRRGHRRTFPIILGTMLSSASAYADKVDDYISFGCRRSTYRACRWRLSERAKSSKRRGMATPIWNFMSALRRTRPIR